MSVTMSSVIILLSPLLIILIARECQGNAILPNCVTPDDALGACVNVKYCVSIMTALINNDHLTNPEVARFLRESQCGIEAGSQKVCCNIANIDFGDDSITDDAESATPPAPRTGLQPPPLPPSNERDSSISNFQKCGKLYQGETSMKWIAELWFRHDRFGGIQYEAKCLGTVISQRHVVMPAHCVASLPANISLAYAKIGDNEYTISRIFVHGSYNQPKFANDIAIIELTDDNNNSEQHPINNAICIEMSNANALKSTDVVIKRTESALKYGKISFIANNQCTSFFERQQNTDLTAGQFCANIQQQSNESEYSPFIGAVVLQSDITGQYSLKGFTSTTVRTEQAFDESKPYIFTNVEQQLTWIRAAIGDNLPSHSSPRMDALDVLKECQLPNDNIGRCVNQEQCTLYRNAPRPLSTQQEAFLRQIKCSTDHQNPNQINEDGICCPDRYVNPEASSSSSLDIDIDVRFRGRRGTNLLDMKMCGHTRSTRRIVGGRKADLNEFPWYALIKYKVGRSHRYTCGASLISSRYVLTCAHCITNLPQSHQVVAVRLGEYDLTTDPDCVSYNETHTDCNAPVRDVSIERLIPHSLYNTPRFANDIGLVRLAVEVQVERNGIMPICLPINNVMQQTLTNKYTVAGFGHTEHGRDSDVLLKIVVPKVSKETCQSFHRSSIKLSEGHTCYGGEGIIDSCKGDSGSPLFNYVNVDGRLKAVQMGIVAAGHGACGQGVTGFPGVYTDVPSYISWILDNLEE